MCIRDRRADAAAQGLGVEVEGVISCELSIEDGLGHGMMFEGAASEHPMMKRRGTVSSLEEQAGIELVKRIELRASAQVHFRLSSLSQAKGLQVAAGDLA